MNIVHKISIYLSFFFIPNNVCHHTQLQKRTNHVFFESSSLLCKSNLFSLGKMHFCAKKRANNDVYKRLKGPLRMHQNCREIIIKKRKKGRAINRRDSTYCESVLLQPAGNHPHPFSRSSASPLSAVAAITSCYHQISPLHRCCLILEKRTIIPRVIKSLS